MKIIPYHVQTGTIGERNRKWRQKSIFATYQISQGGGNTGFLDNF